jgi:hypothetical protein
MRVTYTKMGWVGVFTAPLHSNGSYSIVACVFVAAGMCLTESLPSNNVYSEFAIPAFGRHSQYSF